MLPSFLLALREGIEAALIVGMLAGVLRRIRRMDCLAVLWLGTASGVTVSVIAALLLRALGLHFAGEGEAIYEGTVGLAAAALLTGMIFWLRRHAGRESEAARTNLRFGVRCGRGAVFAVAFVAVVREGLELALFLNAVVLHSAASTVLAGAMLGLLVAAACGWVLFATTLRFSVRRFFQVSGALLLLLAAGFVSHAVGEFIEVGWIPPLIEPIWNTTGWLPETSTGGAILKTLFGYESTPSLAEVAAYVLFLLAVGWALRRSRATIKPSGESILTAVAGRELSQQASEPRKSQAVCGGR